MKAENGKGTFFRILNRIPVFLLALFILCILAFALWRRAEFCGYRTGDNPVWARQDIPFLAITLFLLLIAFLLIYRLCLKLNRFNRKEVVWNILFLSMVVQTLFILYMPAKQFADQNVVNQIALDMIKGNFNAFKKKGYLYQYPNNVGITVFLTFLYRIFPKTMLVPKLINVLFSTATTYFTFKTYEEVCQPKKHVDYGILIFAGFFVPMILLNNLIYNDIMATTLFAAFVFFAVRFVKTNKGWYLVPGGFFIIAGNFLRQVGIIFLLAGVIYFILKKKSFLKTIAFFLVVLILCKLPLTAVNYCLIKTGKINEPIGLNAIPIHMWLHIGMNEKKFGYWDNAHSWSIYVRDGQWSKERSKMIYTALIKKNIEEKGIAKIAKIYIKKNLWLWTEGTYQAEYYGIGQWGYLYDTALTKYASNNLLLRDYLRWYMHVDNLLMLGLSVIGLLYGLRKKADYPLVLPVIVLLGFISFYTLWEIKPRYIYLIYPYLMMMSYYGLGVFSDILTHLMRQIGRGKVKALEEGTTNENPSNKDELDQDHIEA
ncbi:MAG: glycosyltransferase family 39 protein, partial [Clostridia bacterium]|nr:glycosyltransferase family 39 protein [Clostridia bacterium]